MKKTLFSLLIGYGTALTAQTNTGVQTEHGYRFINHTHKEGAKAQAGQTVSVNVYTYLGDSLMGSTVRDFGGPRDLQLPTLEQLGNQRVPALFDAAVRMAEGDSATIYQPLDSNMLRAVPKSLHGVQEVRFEIVLVDLKTQAELEAERLAAERAAAAAKVEGAKVAELVKTTLAEYNAGKLGKRLQKTASGLEYVIVQPGAGEPIKEGDYVTTHYYGVLKANGTMFDNSYDRGAPVPFPVGSLVPGFNEGMMVVGRGGKAILFIPYDLAYGETENGPIPAKSDLVFYIELGAGK